MGARTPQAAGPRGRFGRWRPRRQGVWPLFLFFSRRLGCAGSVLVSLALSLLVVWLLGWL